MPGTKPKDDPSAPAVSLINGEARGPVVICCDHASNHVPPAYGTLGLDPAELGRHIAWDPGALPVALAMADRLDAPLVASGISRLVIDCNRPLNAPDLIAQTSESTDIPGNRGVDEAEKARRVALAHAPFHAALEALLDRREAAGLPTWLVSVHSFTPVYRGVARPWHIGILHDDDMRLSAPMIAALQADVSIVVGDNQPYSPADRVYYTLERHGRARGLPCAMVEIRNDEIASTEGQKAWGDRLSRILAGLLAEKEAPRRARTGRR